MNFLQIGITLSTRLAEVENSHFGVREVYTAMLSYLDTILSLKKSLKEMRKKKFCAEKLQAFIEKTAKQAASQFVSILTTPVSNSASGNATETISQNKIEKKKKTNVLSKKSIVESLLEGPDHKIQSNEKVPPVEKINQEPIVLIQENYLTSLMLMHQQLDQLKQRVNSTKLTEAITRIKNSIDTVFLASEKMNTALITTSEIILDNANQNRLHTAMQKLSSLKKSLETNKNTLDEHILYVQSLEIKIQALSSKPDLLESLDHDIANMSAMEESILALEKNQLTLSKQRAEIERSLGKINKSLKNAPFSGTDRQKLESHDESQSTEPELCVTINKNIPMTPEPTSEPTSELTSEPSCEPKSEASILTDSGSEPESSSTSSTMTDPSPVFFFCDINDPIVAPGEDTPRQLAPIGFRKNESAPSSGELPPLPPTYGSYSLFRNSSVSYVMPYELLIANQSWPNQKRDYGLSTENQNLKPPSTPSKIAKPTTTVEMGTPATASPNERVKEVKPVCTTPTGFAFIVFTPGAGEHTSAASQTSPPRQSNSHG